PVEPVEVGRRHLVVAPHGRRGTELGQVVHEVVDEAVVVVDDEDAHRLDPPPRYWSTVTSLNGSRGSTYGNTTRNSSATTARISMAEPMTLPGTPPGSLRQIQPYTSIPPSAAGHRRRGALADRERRPVQFGVDDHPLP